MRNKVAKIAKIGLVVYLILFVYIMIFEDISAMNTFTRVIFVVTPFVLHFAINGFKKSNRKNKG